MDLRKHAAYRLVRTLEREQMLERTGGAGTLRFHLGPAVAELKHLHNEQHLLSVGARVLVRAHARMPDANLALLDRDGVQTYQRLSLKAGAPGRLVRRRMYVVAPYAKASSLLFLAYSDPATRAKFFERYPFEDEGEPIWKTPLALEDFLARVRKLKRAQPGFPDQQWFRLAVPVFSTRIEPIAAIAGYMPNSATLEDRHQLVRVSLDAAKRISQILANSMRGVDPADA